MTEKVFPIVLACDDNYAPYCGVAIQSLKEQAKSDGAYRIYVLQDRLSPEHIAKMESMSEEKFQVSCLNVGHLVDEDKMYAAGIWTKEMYYRLMIPQLLPQYEKVLYLDCDVVALADVAPLFDLEMGDAVVAAAPDFEEDDHSGQFASFLQNFCKVTQRPAAEFRTYFNSGVLLIECDRYRKSDIFAQCIDFLATHPDLCTPDQDTLNTVVYPYVLYLDKKWNYRQTDDTTRTPRNTYKRLTQLREAEIQILHYTCLKPWNGLDNCFCSYFWTTASHSPYAETLIPYLTAHIDELFENSHTTDTFARSIYRGDVGMRGILGNFTQNLSAWFAYKRNKR